MPSSHVAAAANGESSIRLDQQHQTASGDSRGGLSQALEPRGTVDATSGSGTATGLSQGHEAGAAAAAAAHGQAASARGQATSGGSPPRGALGGGSIQQQQQRHHTPANHLLNFQRYDSRGGTVRAAFHRVWTRRQYMPRAYLLPACRQQTKHPSTLSMPSL